MPLITANNLEKSFGDDVLFSRVSFGIEKDDRIGLVGRNGEGKTTLMKLMLNEAEPSAGSITRQRDLRLGYLPQVPPTLDDRTLNDFMDDAFRELHEMERALDDLAAQMADPDHDDAVTQRYTDLQHEFEHRDGYNIPTRIQTVLSGLGFSEDQQRMAMTQFSGGWRTRAYLARLLLEEPDVLLLDEPTNHLDLAATRWLENFLSGWKGALLIVSHDRFFLNRICNRIWEMADGAVEAYKGNYDAFLTQRDARFEERMKTWEAQQRHIEETEEFIRRHLAGQRTKEAQGRRTKLERFLKRDAIAKPRKMRNIHINFGAIDRSGDQVLQTGNLVIGYDGEPLATVPTFELERGNRLGIVGANGAGKTTLLKTIVGQLPKIAGGLRFGTRVETGYLSQTHDDLNHSLSALDAIREAMDRPDDSKARNLLGALLFSGDDVFKCVDDLSGGERSRLALARLALRGANLLLLDEPTNHLDIPSQEVLQDLLKDYPGTLIFVSHDRYLVQNLADHLLVFEDDTIVFFRGTWDDYQLSKQGGTSPAPAELKQSESVEKPDYKEEKRRKNELKRQIKRFETVEREIHALEDEKQLLEYAIGKASEAQDMDELNKVTAELAAVDSKLEELYDEWSTLAELVE